MIGPCAYLTCDSKVGSTFRSAFCSQPGGYDWNRDGKVLVYISGAEGWRIEDVLLCATHTRLFETIRKTDGYRQFMMTTEGWVYLRAWVDAMGFVA